MASLANKDEAVKCRDMAKVFLSRGEHEKALRFFEKSLKLYPLPEVPTLRDIAKVSLHVAAHHTIQGTLLHPSTPPGSCHRFLARDFLSR